MTDFDASLPSSLDAQRHEAVRNRYFLYLIAFLANIVGGGYTFTASRLFADAQDSMLMTGLVGSSMMFGYILTAFLAGFASDRLGRKTVIGVGSLLGAVVCLATYFLASSPSSMIYLLVGILGAANGVIYPATIGAITSECEESETSRVLIHYTYAWNFGLIVGTTGAGLLFDLANGAKTAFLLCGLAMVCVLASTISLRRITASASDRQEEDEKIDRSEARSFVWICWVGLFAATFTVGLVQFVFPRYAVVEGITADLHGYMLGGNRVAGLLTYLVLNFTVFWRYRIRTIIFANIIGIAVLLFLTSVSTPSLVFIAISLASVFPSIAYFQAIYYGASAFPFKKRGMVGGINETVIALGFISGPIAGGWLGDVTANLRMPFYVGAAMIGVVACVQMILWWKRRSTGTKKR